ncbi:hypothetical protein ACIA49_12625 [Kribbella sp. NPDC051587]|uniref:hypothetical protein n=1 Tax=Kribbella sp. NPDC051587 TaxID=3364119 RepID=UPI00379709D0
MSGAAGYVLIAGPEFDLDYRRIDAAAQRNPGGPEAVLRRQVLRAMLDVANGRSDGHHALGYAPGKGDLRDCVTEYVHSDPQRKADLRLVFREMAPEVPGSPARRELLAIRGRHGVNNVYAHVCARLGRQVTDRQPGLDRFGRESVSGGNGAARQAELDARRAVAHAWAGQRPLRSSRPLAVGTARASGDGSATVAREQPRSARAGPTGWPERG